MPQAQTEGVDPEYAGRRGRSAPRCEAPEATLPAGGGEGLEDSSSRRRCSAPTSAVSARSRCHASSGWRGLLAFPVDQLLPPDAAEPPSVGRGVAFHSNNGDNPEASGKPFKIAVDLLRLSEVQGPERAAPAGSSPRCRCSGRTSTARC